MLTNKTVGIEAAEPSSQPAGENPEPVNRTRNPPLTENRLLFMPLIDGAARVRPKRPNNPKSPLIALNLRKNKFHKKSLGKLPLWFRNRTDTFCSETRYKSEFNRMMHIERVNSENVDEFTDIKFIRFD